jgi:alanyl-tRNA synthetase
MKNPRETIRDYYEYAGGDPVAASILEIRPRGDLTTLVLDRTIFYPEGGGQGADRGTINGVPLEDVREEGGEILHLIRTGAALSPGPAELRLDKKRRRDLTVCHTAQHLLSGTILRMTGAPTVSMHLGEELCTIDVNAPELSLRDIRGELSDTLTALEEETADAIEGDYPVIVHLCPPEKLENFPLRKVPPRGEAVIRVVEIRGHDFSPCCGTHLASTGGIGMLRILGAEKYKGMIRISFIAGRRVLRDSRMLRRNGELISRALKVPLTETAQGVLSLLDKTNELERELKASREEAAEYKAEKLLAEMGTDGCTPPLIRLVFADEDMEEALRIGRAAQKISGAVVLAASRKEAKFAALAPKTADLRSFLQESMAARNGRGGGSPAFFQGAFENEAELLSFLEALPESGPPAAG